MQHVKRSTLMCEKGALWEEGRKPVSQEAASLPIISFLKKRKKERKKEKKNSEGKQITKVATSR